MEETWFMAVQENSIVLFGEWKGINQRGLILASNSCCSSCCHCDVQTHWKQKLIVTMEATALIKPTPVNVTEVTYLFPTTLEKLFREWNILKSHTIEAKSRKLPNYFDVNYVFDGFWGKYYKEQLFSLRKNQGDCWSCGLMLQVRNSTELTIWRVGRENVGMFITVVQDYV